MTYLLINTPRLRYVRTNRGQTQRAFVAATMTGTSVRNVHKPFQHNCPCLIQVFMSTSVVLFYLAHEAYFLSTALALCPFRCWPILGVYLDLDSDFSGMCGGGCLSARRRRQQEAGRLNSAQYALAAAQSIRKASTRHLGLMQPGEVRATEIHAVVHMDLMALYQNPKDSLDWSCDVSNLNRPSPAIKKLWKVKATSERTTAYRATRPVISGSGSTRGS